MMIILWWYYLIVLLMISFCYWHYMLSLMSFLSLLLVTDDMHVLLVIYMSLLMIYMLLLMIEKKHVVTDDVHVVTNDIIVVIIGGSRGGVPGARPPPTGPDSFILTCKIFKM